MQFNVTRLLRLSSCTENVTIFRTFFFGRNETDLHYIQKEKSHAAKNYKPSPVVLSQGEGVYVWDLKGCSYLDFYSGNGSVCLGHCHRKLKTAIIAQSLTLTSPAYYNNVYPLYAEYITKYFSYDKVLPFTSGMEAMEGGVKLARGWGYRVKGVKCPIVLVAEGGRWFRRLTQAMTKAETPWYDKAHPQTAGYSFVPYDDLCALEEALKDESVVGFLVEPVQEGAVFPSDDYLEEVRKLCSKQEVLLMVDELDTCLGRCGALLASYHHRVRPDILLIGRALGAGITPVSAVLGDDCVMSQVAVESVTPSSPGNPIASKIAKICLQVINEECLSMNSAIQGERLRSDLLCRLPKEVVPQIRGKGLLNAIILNTEICTSYQVAERLLRGGLLAVCWDDSTLMLTPPLIINDVQITQAVNIISTAVHSFCTK